jgi:RNA polymerase sigma-70 factor, ECF subfamily
MPPNEPSGVEPAEVTRLLNEMRAGHAESAGQLIDCVYKELRRLAAYYMKAERSDHTLQPTALVHEVFLRVLGGESVEWQNRAHFFAVAARQMRHILVDHARALKAEKRGGGMKVSLEEAGSLAGRPDEDLLVVDEALSKFEDVDPRAAKVVELKFFSGLTDKEAAEVLGVPLISVRRDWEFAKAWLFHRLTVAE